MTRNSQHDIENSDQKVREPGDDLALDPTSQRDLEFLLLLEQKAKKLLLRNKSLLMRLLLAVVDPKSLIKEIKILTPASEPSKVDDSDDEPTA
jgi:propanediol utilization protein